MLHVSRRDILKTAVAGTLGLGLVGPATGTTTSNDRYIVTAQRGNAAKRLEREGFTVTRELAGGEVLLVAGAGNPADVKGVGTAVRDLKFRLERPEETRRVSNPEADTEDESYYGLQWDKQTTDAADAHEMTTGDGATIAVIDTGADLDHPDLAPNVVPGALFRDVAGEDGGVYTETGVDVRVPKIPVPDIEEVLGPDCTSLGYDADQFELVDDQHPSNDVDGHGSHVSGIAAASRGVEVFPEADPGFTGVVGMAPDATVVPHRVFYWGTEEVVVDDGDGEDDPGPYDDGSSEEETMEVVTLQTTTADILAAIDFAASFLEVDAMNMSIGTPPLPPQYNRQGFRQAYRLVIQDAVRKGSVVVVSAGNSATELNKGGLFTVPNSVPGAMSISATGPNDERVFYSNYGANEVDVGAPGGGYDTLEKTLAAPYIWELIYGQDDDDEPTVDLDDDGTPDADTGFEYPVDEPIEGTCDVETTLVNTDPVEYPYPYNLVYSTTPPDVYGSAYAFFAGTSMAAPQVTGVAALVRAANPELNAKQVEQAIENGATKATGREKDDLGAGLLNAYGAVTEATR